MLKLLFSSEVELGFYFGQRPVQSLTRQVERESSEKSKFKTNYGESLSEAIDNVEEARKAKQQVIELSQKLIDIQAKYEKTIESMLNSNDENNKQGGV